MVSIRLSRGGAKKRPFYHIVVTDRRNRRDGRYIERIGFFNPVAKGKEQRLQIDIERVDHWLGHGAQASDRVTTLLKSFRKAAATPAPGGAETAPAKAADLAETAPAQATDAAAAEVAEAGAEARPAGEDETTEAKDAE